ncbi:MAG TPA: GNAT family N-acetyltransferase [Vicinamibacterales bacterium]|nr:GNAT family N-acetyltransferase [Vicinamibacterales bacterium]
MRLVTAEGPALERILEESHAIWSDGLTPGAYVRFNAAQMRTPWGARHLRRLALVDDAGDVVSSAKRYDLAFLLDGIPVRGVGIGAVFTPEPHRRRGHARAIVEEILHDAAGEGAGVALLFSEIDPAYYTAMGFVPVPRPELLLRVTGKAGAPAVLVRAGEERDIPAVTALARGMASRHRFAVDPTEDFVRFSLSKKRLLAGLLPPDMLNVEFFIVEEGAGAVAFAILTATSDDVVLEMCGDRDPSGARVGALLQVLRARTPAESVRSITALLPPGWLPPQLEIESAAPAREVMMVRPLAGDVLASRLRSDDVLYWHGDRI